MADDVLTLEMFSDKLDQVFTIEEPGVPTIKLKLIEAKAVKNYMNAERPPFSVIFATKGDFVLVQRIYQLRNAAMGTLGIFIVPIAKKDDTVTYQAIFN